MTPIVSIGDYKGEVKGDVGVNLASEHNIVDLVFVDTPGNREEILKMRQLRDILNGLQLLSVLPDTEGAVLHETSKKVLDLGYQAKIPIREVGFVTRK